MGASPSRLARGRARSRGAFGRAPSTAVAVQRGVLRRTCRGGGAAPAREVVSEFGKRHKTPSRARRLSCTHSRIRAERLQMSDAAHVMEISTPILSGESDMRTPSASSKENAICVILRLCVVIVPFYGQRALQCVRRPWRAVRAVHAKRSAQRGRYSGPWAFAILCSSDLSPW